MNIYHRVIKPTLHGLCFFLIGGIGLAIAVLVVLGAIEFFKQVLYELPEQGVWWPLVTLSILGFLWFCWYIGREVDSIKKSE